MESPLIVREQLGLLVYYYFLPPKKKIYISIVIEKQSKPFYSIPPKTVTVDPAYMTFDLLRSYSTRSEKPLLSVYFENRLSYMHENFCIIRPKYADDTVLLYCVFNDPWESYYPWNLIKFTQKFKTRKLIVVETQNQLECVRWPLTLKISQGQRSRSSRFYENKAFL